MKTYKEKIGSFMLVKDPEAEKIQKAKITSSKDAADYCRQFFGESIEVFESFYVLLLNRANNTIGYQKISQGGINGTVADVHLMVYYAINSLAKNIILLHNHPSGNLEPSKADEYLTYKAKNALKFFDIQVLDHIILSQDGYFSLTDEGKM